VNTYANFHAFITLRAIFTPIALTSRNHYGKEPQRVPTATN